MSTPSYGPLEEAIRKADEEWLIDSFAPPNKAIDHLRHVLDQVHQRARERLGNDAPDLREAAIVAAFQEHPSQVRGFFQALGGARTPDMLLMVWRIIQGMSIKDVHLSYRMQDSFVLQVVLESPYGVQDAPYESSNINDFMLFRHIGIMQIDDKPMFDGFYPLRVRGLS